MSDNIIEIRNVTKTYGAKDAVKNASLNIKRGEFVTLLGPSGCGKTTTLRMIAGFEMPTSGQIIFDGEDITNLPPHLRRVNTVFQKYALFPHLNVFNAALDCLKMKLIPNGTKRNRKGEEVQLYRKYTKAEIKAKVDAALKMVDLEDYGHRGVSSLSGGQQQRVAIARAIVNEPEVLLLDEPLGALDLKMRKDMQLELMDMHKRLGITFVYVTPRSGGGSHHERQDSRHARRRHPADRHPPRPSTTSPQTPLSRTSSASPTSYRAPCLRTTRWNLRTPCSNAWTRASKHNEPIDVIISSRGSEDQKEGRPEDHPHRAGHLVGVQGRPLSGDADGGRERAHRARHRDLRSGFHRRAVHQAFRPAHHAQVPHHQRDRHRDGGRERGVDLGRQVRMQLLPPRGTPVRVKVDFDDVEITDDEEDGVIGATVVSSIYKGSYYQCIVRTDDYYDFFVDNRRRLAERRPRGHQHRAREDHG